MIRKRRTRTEHPLERIERKLDLVGHKLDTLRKEVHRMAVDQATFDAELQDLVAAIAQVVEAVDALLAAQPAGVDLTAEAQTVADAKATLVAELAKITPQP